jgi:transcriptional antiterminator Rof (Rho-off)
MKVNQSYVPVSCDFIDHIEICATRKKVVELIYHDNSQNEVRLGTRLKTWETKNKMEYLVTTDELRLRLDKVKAIDGFLNEGSCSF